ncbi:MAG TPA: hypothetical protein VF366_01925, partial [Dehalococcoidia bacterium]
ASMTPISGDWNNDGIDEIGIYDPNTQKFYLRSNNDVGGSAWKTVKYGSYTTNKPITGDWNGLYISCAKVQTGRTWKPACYFRCLRSKINGEASASTIGQEPPNPKQV